MESYAKKILSLMLMVCVSITSIHVTTVESQAYEKSLLSENVSEQKREACSEDSFVLYEEITMREENVKHFRMSDGSYLAAQYELPVHYQDVSGKWQDYDNSLEETVDGTELINRKSDKEVVFSKKAKQNKLVQLSIDGYPISWGYEKSS